MQHKMRHKMNGSTLEAEEVRQTCRVGLRTQGKFSVSLSLTEKNVNPVKKNISGIT